MATIKWNERVRLLFARHIEYALQEYGIATTTKWFNRKKQIEDSISRFPESLEPTEQTFLNVDIQSAVEETLRRKAAERHYSYKHIPLTSQRYRFVALNEIAKRLARVEE